MGTEVGFTKRDIRNMAPAFKVALPAQVPTDRFIRTIETALQLNPKLYECTKQSVLAACTLAAQDGLIIGGGQAALVPFFNSKAKLLEAKYMVMVAGIITRARNTGLIDAITPVIVHKNDDFAIDYASKNPLTFKMEEGDRGDAIGAICIVWMKGSDVPEFEYMTEAEIMAVKGCSKQQASLQWTTFWTEGWKKTVIRRLFKRLPMSSDMGNVFQSWDDDIDLNAKPAADQDEEPEAATPKKSAGMSAIDKASSDFVEGEVIEEEAEEEDAI